MTATMLEATRRPVGKGAARRVRRSNRVPGVVYGAGVDPVAVSVDELALGQVVRDGALHRVLILRIAGEAERTVLIQHLQRDHIGNNVLAVDFHLVDTERPIRIRVPVHMVGEEILVGRAQVAQLHETELEVECLSSAMPDRIDINVADLHPGEHIAVRQLPWLAGVVYTDDPDRVVVTVASHAEGPADTAPETIDPA